MTLYILTVCLATVLMLWSLILGTAQARDWEPLCQAAAGLLCLAIVAILLCRKGNP